MAIFIGCTLVLSAARQAAGGAHVNDVIANPADSLAETRQTDEHTHLYDFKHDTSYTYMQSAVMETHHRNNCQILRHRRC